MIHCKIHPAAQDEHDDLVTFFAGIDEALAIAFEEQYQECRRMVCANPARFPAQHGHIHRAELTPRFGDCCVAYTVWQSKVVILAVAHVKRQPCQWRQRMAEAEDLFFEAVPAAVA